MCWQDDLQAFEPDVYEHEDAPDDDRYCDMCGVYAGRHALVSKTGMFCPEHAPADAIGVEELEVEFGDFDQSMA